MNHAQYDIGVIHGRFQILHNDHMKYLIAGKSLCRHLVVGITNPEPLLSLREDEDPERCDPQANPLTYYERYSLVNAALEEAAVDRRELSVVPFPISFPDRYHYYVPIDAVFFLTIYDEWGRKKLRYFQQQGLRTHVLWEVPLEKKGISAGDVRRRMIGDLPWTQLVPQSVGDLLIGWKIPERLKDIIRSL